MDAGRAKARLLRYGGSVVDGVKLISSKFSVLFATTVQFCLLRFHKFSGHI